MMPGLKVVAHEDFLALRKGAEVIEADGHGEKVLRLTDGTLLKLFRRKRILSSAAWYPYAQRFASNALALRERGIPVPTVIATVRIPSIKRDAVRYHPLPGESLRALARRGLEPAAERELKRKFTDFVIHLHALGIYFRSLHLGNVILTPSGELGLIDFSDLRVYARPLPVFMRRRNIQRMLGMEGEREWIDSEAILQRRAS